MSDSLKDQLISLGLAKTPEARKHKPKKPRPAAKKKDAGGEMSLDQAWRLRKKEEKDTATAKREQKRVEDLLRREVNAKIKAIVEAHALNDKDADIKRNFLYKGRIRSVLVTAEQLRAINAGEMGLVFLRGNYHIMLPEYVDAVRAISTDHVPDLGGDASEEEEFPVPDDLIW